LNWALPRSLICDSYSNTALKSTTGFALITSGSAFFGVSAVASVYLAIAGLTVTGLDSARLAEVGLIEIGLLVAAPAISSSSSGFEPSIAMSSPSGT